MGTRAAIAILIGALLLLTVVLAVALRGAREPAWALEGGLKLPTNGAAEPIEALAPPEATFAPMVAAKSRSDVSSTPTRGPELRFELALHLEASGSPASEAEIYYYGPDERMHPGSDAEFARLGLGRQFFERNARCFVADAKGHAQVPFVRGTLQLIALHGDAFGMGSFELDGMPAAPVQLALRDARSIEVIVRRIESEEPVRDVAVQALRRAGRDAPVGGETDANGRVRLWPLFEDPELANLWTARIDGQLREEAAVSFRLDGPDNPLELRLPPTGSALVRLVGSDGALLRLPAILQMAWNDAEDEPGHSSQVLFREGIVSLPCVELGLTVHLRAELIGINHRISSQVVLSGGNRARIDMTVADPLVPRLHGRLLDAQGSLLGRATAVCIVALRREGEGNPHVQVGLTPIDSELLIALGAKDLSSTPAVLALRTDRPGESSLGGVFHVELQQGITELGDLRLEPATLLAAGRVLDSDDRPVVGASILLDLDKRQAGAPICITMRESRSNDAGEFEIWGWSEPGVFALEVRREGWATLRATAARAQLGLVLRME